MGAARRQDVLGGVRYDTLQHRVHHSFLTRCIRWRKINSADHPILYLDTIIKTGSESIEVTIRKRRSLFAGFVARMKDTILPKCAIFGELTGGGRGLRREWMCCFLGDLRAFSINADQWTTVDQDEGG